METDRRPFLESELQAELDAARLRRRCRSSVVRRQLVAAVAEEVGVVQDVVALGVELHREPLIRSVAEESAAATAGAARSAATGSTAAGTDLLQRRRCASAGRTTAAARTSAA